jgi:Icc-related predicted phosphoesterase
VGSLQRILFATDLHGSESAFRKLVNAAVKYEIDTLVLGGDLTGKALVPIIAVNGHHEADLDGQTLVAHGESEVAEMERTIRLGGQYTFHSTPDEVEELRSDPRGIDEAFHRAQRESLQSWFDLAEERLAPRGVQAFVIAGNDDPFEIDDVLLTHDYVRSIDGGTAEIADGVWILGLGGSTPTPWRTPREYEEEDLAGRLLNVIEQLPDPHMSIWNVHVPPYASGLDVAPELKPDLSIRMQGGEPATAPVGSRAVRDAIAAHQPLAALHGHVHESRGFGHLGKTLIVNPGSDYTQGVLRAAYVVLKGQKVRVQLMAA